MKVIRTTFSIMLMAAMLFTGLPMISGNTVNAASPYWKKLSVSASNTTVNAKWTKLTKKQQKKITGIAVFRDGKEIKKLKKSAKSFSDAGLKEGNTYKYQFKTYKKSTKKVKMYYNKKTKEWQTKKIKKTKTKKVKKVTYKYGNASPIKSVSIEKKETPSKPTVEEPTEPTPVATYTITWKNWDGKVLQTSAVKENTTPTYTGSTPQRAADSNNTYSFTGWSPAVASAHANATYTAQFKATAKPVDPTPSEPTPSEPTSPDESVIVLDNSVSSTASAVYSKIMNDQEFTLQIKAKDAYQAMDKFDELGTELAKSNAYGIKPFWKEMFWNPGTNSYTGYFDKLWSNGSYVTGVSMLYFDEFGELENINGNKGLYQIKFNHGVRSLWQAFQKWAATTYTDKNSWRDYDVSRYGSMKFSQLFANESDWNTEYDLRPEKDYIANMGSYYRNFMSKPTVADVYQRAFGDAHKPYGQLTEEEKLHYLMVTVPIDKRETPSSPGRDYMQYSANKNLSSNMTSNIDKLLAHQAYGVCGDFGFVNAYVCQSAGLKAWDVVGSGHMNCAALVKNSAGNTVLYEIDNDAIKVITSPSQLRLQQATKEAMGADWPF